MGKLREKGDDPRATDQLRMERLQQLAEKEQLESSVEKGKPEKAASDDAVDRAAKKAAEIEKKLTREQRTELQNEIADIVELRDEYKKLLATVLSFEKSKKQKDLEKIAPLSQARLRLGGYPCLSYGPRPGL